jgi:hypothetical protein
MNIAGAVERRRVRREPMDTATLAGDATPPPKDSSDPGHRQLVRSLIVACLAAGAWLVVHAP